MCCFVENEIVGQIRRKEMYEELQKDIQSNIR